MTGRELTPFSYAILALVGDGGAGPHDIVLLLRRSVTTWAAAESHTYAEPKRLARLGYLSAECAPGRTRERTQYRLTEQGRAALRVWLVQPTPFPRIQDEAAVRLLAAGSVGDDAALLTSLGALRAELDEVDEGLDVAEALAETLPHGARYLRLLHRLGRSVVRSRREWLDDVERELAAGGGAPVAAGPLLVVAATVGELAGLPAASARVVALACGIGPVEAAAATARALAELRPRAVLHVGIAGARRDANLPLRSLVLGAGSVYEDAAGGRLVPHRLAPAAALLAAVQAALPEAVALEIGTSARVGGGAAAPVEAMEGFAVLRACALAGVPAVELRAISNVVEEADRGRWDFAGALVVLAAALPRAIEAL
jgi:nucleoside phosphorylase/DNA-binding PadR family transcriptional regulator